MHHLEPWNDLLSVVQSAVRWLVKQVDVSVVGSDASTGAVPEKGGFALVIAVGQHDPSGPTQLVELLQVSRCHGHRIDQDIALVPHPEMAVEVDLALLAEDGPGIEVCKGYFFHNACPSI